MPSLARSLVRALSLISHHFWAGTTDSDAIKINLCMLPALKLLLLDKLQGQGEERGKADLPAQGGGSDDERGSRKTHKQEDSEHEKREENRDNRLEKIEMNQEQIRMIFLSMMQEKRREGRGEEYREKEGEGEGESKGEGEGEEVGEGEGEEADRNGEEYWPQDAFGSHRHHRTPHGHSQHNHSGRAKNQSPEQV